MGHLLRVSDDLGWSLPPHALLGSGVSAEHLGAFNKTQVLSEHTGEEVCQLMRRDFRLKCSDEANLLFAASRGAGGTKLLYANRPAEAQTQTQHEVMEIYSKVSCGRGLHLRYKQTHSREISSREWRVSSKLQGRVGSDLGLGGVAFWTGFGPCQQ